MSPTIQTQVLVYQDETGDFPVLQEGKYRAQILLFVPNKYVVRSQDLFTRNQQERLVFYDLWQKFEQLVPEKLRQSKFHFNEINGRKWGPKDKVVADLVSEDLFEGRVTLPVQRKRPSCFGSHYLRR